VKKDWVIFALAFLVFPLAAFAQTVEDLRAQILSLISQIQALQSQPTDWEPLPAPDFCHMFLRDLGVGNSGQEVEALQLALQYEGFPIVETELGAWYFGGETASAVAGFQEKYRNEILLPAGLAVGNGFVGFYTRTQLNNLYGC